jgi:hypothetical protein
MRLAVATRTTGTPIEGALDANVAFVLTDGPGSTPLLLAADVDGPRTRFLGQVAPHAYVAGLEVVTSKGVGWARRRVEPLRAAGPELSDLLLFDPPDGADPMTHRAATAAMLGSTTVRPRGGVGVYWETYEPPGGATLQIELTIERESGGLVDRVRRLLPGGPEEERGRITWREEATAPAHPGSVVIDLSDLGEGDYTLVLRVGWEGLPAMERRRGLTIASD